MDGHAGAGRPTGQLCGLVQEKQSWFEAGSGRTTKYSTMLSVTHTHTHTHTHSGLCNGPTYVALALWLNSPPCKWSGVGPPIAKRLLASGGFAPRPLDQGLCPWTPLHAHACHILCPLKFVMAPLASSSGAGADAPAIESVIDWLQLLHLVKALNLYGVLCKRELF